MKKRLIIILLGMFSVILSLFFGFALLFAYSGIVDEFPVQIIASYLLFTLLLIGLFLFYCNKKQIGKFYIVLILPIILIIISFIAFPIARYQLSHFRDSLWKNHPQIRHYMINSFEQQYKPMGKSENEIIELLGVPEDRNENELLYDVGWNFPDYVAYCLKIENGMVVELYNKDY